VVGEASVKATPTKKTSKVPKPSISKVKATQKTPLAAALHHAGQNNASSNVSAAGVGSKASSNASALHVARKAASNTSVTTSSVRSPARLPPWPRVLPRFITSLPRCTTSQPRRLCTW
jgi:hypothetical protein